MSHSFNPSGTNGIYDVEETKAFHSKRKDLMSQKRARLKTKLLLLTTEEHLTRNKKH